MSATVFKGFEQCEAAELAQLKGEYKPAGPRTGANPLIMGNFIHSYFQSKKAHEAFCDESDAKKDIFKYGNPDKGMKAAYKGQAMQMIHALEKQELFSLYDAGNGKNKEVIVTGKLGGHLWKGKIDSLNLDEGYFCDLKTVDDFHKGHWNPELRQKVNFIEDRGYYLQMAVYQQLIYQTFGKMCQPFIFAVSKQTPPDVMAIDFNSVDDSYLMDQALQQINDDQDHFWCVMMGEEKPKRCGHCEYCRKTQKLTGFVHASDIEVE